MKRREFFLGLALDVVFRERHCMRTRVQFAGGVARFACQSSEG